MRQEALPSGSCAEPGCLPLRLLAMSGLPRGDRHSDLPRTPLKHVTEGGIIYPDGSGSGGGAAVSGVAIASCRSCRNEKGRTMRMAEQAENRSATRGRWVMKTITIHRGEDEDTHKGSCA